MGFTDRYIATILVGNHIPQGDPIQARTETSRIEIQGAVVRITDAAGNQLNTYTAVTAGTIDPASGSSPSYAVMDVEAIDPSVVASFLGEAGSKALPGGDSILSVGGTQQQLISYMKVFGQTLGDHVESNDFEFPISICAGSPGQRGGRQGAG